MQQIVALYQFLFKIGFHGIASCRPWFLIACSVQKLRTGKAWEHYIPQLRRGYSRRSASCVCVHTAKNKAYLKIAMTALEYEANSNDVFVYCLKSKGTVASPPNSPVSLNMYKISCVPPFAWHSIACMPHIKFQHMRTKFSIGFGLCSSQLKGSAPEWAKL